MGQVEHPGESGERPRQSLGDAAEATSGEAGEIDEEIVSTSGEEQHSGGPGGTGGGESSISDDAERAIQDIQDRRAGG
jgi:hypothetical protein